MHDIDRALFEAESEAENEEAEHDEFLDQQEYGETGDREAELATELLEVTTEEELDRFLGTLLDGAVSAARSFARSDRGRAVGGALKSAARKALPHVGQALGGSAGKQVGRWLGRQFELGLETEGLSAEDREYEVAQAFVRFARDAAQRAAQSGRVGDPRAVARRAVNASAQRYLPGLVTGATSETTRRSQEGRWIRRGDRIVLLGV